MAYTLDRPVWSMWLGTSLSIRCPLVMNASVAATILLLLLLASWCDVVLCCKRGARRFSTNVCWPAPCKVRVNVPCTHCPALRARPPDRPPTTFGPLRCRMYIPYKQTPVWLGRDGLIAGWSKARWMAAYFVCGLFIGWHQTEWARETNAHAHCVDWGFMRWINWKTVKTVWGEVHVHSNSMSFISKDTQLIGGNIINN